MNILAVMACDLERTAIGTRSRLAEGFCGESLLARVVRRVLAVEGVEAVALLAPGEQMERVRALAPADERVRVLELASRPAGVSARVRAARAWNLQSWRGGAGQMTVFDEEYHPAGVARAARELGAEHVLAVPSHAAFLDVGLTGALLQHHLHKNHEMRITYTPAAPGLTGFVLRGDIALEMGEKQVMPWQLLAYDPAAPQFDTLIREACMQVDPALSKIPNRFLLDTERGAALAAELAGMAEGWSSAELALAAARAVAPGVWDARKAWAMPREVEIELTGSRLTSPPGCAPRLLREGRGMLDAGHWVKWLGGQRMPDDLLLTFAGDGDALLYPGLVEVLRAARGVNQVCVQTDLASPMEGLVGAIQEGLVDVVSVTMYGQTAETYARVAGADLHGRVMENLAALSAATRARGGRGGVTLVVPRLLKVRETIPEMEAFFDAWVSQAGWAVIESPTTRCGRVASGAVVEMAPPKRRPCRRLWDRLVIRANGRAVACDQDAADGLVLGHIQSQGLAEMWGGARAAELRAKHVEGGWTDIDPCKLCREWHRA